MGTQVVHGTAGDWTFTMPDQITLSQGVGLNGLALDGSAAQTNLPLIIDIRLNADLLFGGSPQSHGIITIDITDLPGGESTPDIVNGLRGPIQIVFHNELGFPINNPLGANNTMAIYLAGDSDIFSPAPVMTPDDAFHTLYTHFHNVEPADFPGLTVVKSVGPFVGAMPGIVDTSPNWLGLDGIIAAGTTSTWGPFTFHRRDTAENDHTTMNFIFYDGAMDPVALAALKAQWDFEHTPPTMDVKDFSVAEGNNTAGVLNYTVSLSKAAPVPITVQYATSNGTGMAGVDYIATSGTLTFAPGEISKTVSVSIIGDIDIEPDETVILTLSGATAPVQIIKAVGTGTITNDDIPPNPSISVADVLVTEGNPINFDVGLFEATSVPVTVSYTTSNGTAQAGSDYTAVSGSLTFAPGETHKTVVVSTTQDTAFEADETLTLTLSNSMNGTLLRAVATGTIRNNDAEPPPTTPPTTPAPTEPPHTTPPTQPPDNFILNGSPQAGTAYLGPVTYLQLQFLGSAGGEVVLGTGKNDFINLLDGTDAADGGAGDDVIDGGLGSNFLTGGAGREVFFLDGRSGGVTWGTITDWQAGEELSLWGWHPGVSKFQWAASAGAQGFLGATMHADLDGNGTIDASVTWSNRVQSDLPLPTEHDGLLWFHP